MDNGEIELRVNGQTIRVPSGAVVAAAVARAGEDRFRRSSVLGQGRGPLCGMGICFECRVTINGEPQQRSCQMPCTPGMEVVTDE